jgi:hypothetical protein
METYTESYIGVPCSCGYNNLLPQETLSHDWQRLICSYSGCKKRYEFRGWHKPLEDDRENFVIQSRPFPYRIKGKFAKR